MTDQALIDLTIDGKPFQVTKGTTVYQAAKLAGIEIPIFCYHERMPPFGACRMCLVQVENMPKLQASCTLVASQGMNVTTQSKMAVDGRKEILELLLINHPLDCPICDRGGECPLQDNVLKYGPGLSRFFEEKRHFKKPIPLGPVLMLDRERCIACARCTRFGDELSGDHALEFKDRGYKLEVGTRDDRPAYSKFIGNTIMICPVGALTSQVYRFRARPWDNMTTDSTCTLCPVGCSIKLDSRDGEIMRTRSNENFSVNDIWLCDKGWFGYEHGANSKRLTTPLVRKNGMLEEVSWEEAISLIGSKIKEAKPQGKLAALGGNPLTTEENYLFQQLVRKGFGVNHLDHRVGMPVLTLEQEGLGPGMEVEIEKLETASSIYLLGLDLTEEFPVLWLRIRQALNKNKPVIFIGNYAPEIASYLTKTVLHPPGKEWEILNKNLPEKTERGVFLVGRQYLASPNRTQILAKLKEYNHFSLNIMEGQDNSLGARFSGMRPDLGPLNQPLADIGLDAQSLLQEMSNGWDYLHIAGCNPAKKFPHKIWSEAKEKLGFLVVQDLFLTETAQAANVVLPVLAYTEKKGRFINIEGRVQHLKPGKRSLEDVSSDGEIFIRIAQKLGIHLIFDKNFLEALGHAKVALPIENRLKANFNTSDENGGKLKAIFSVALFDEGVRMQHNEHLKEIEKNLFVRINPIEAKKRKIANQSFAWLKSSQGKLRAQVKWDEKVSEESIVIPLGFTSIPAYELEPNLINGISIELEADND